MEDKIKNLTLTKVRHFNAFSKIVNNKTSEVKNLKSGLEDIENKQVDIVLYSVELSYLFNDALSTIMIAKELGVELSEEVLEFLEKYSKSIYKRKFSIEGENIVEVERGVLEESRKQFLQSDVLKVISNTLNEK